MECPCPFKAGDVVSTRRPGWNGDDLVKVMHADDTHFYGVLIDSCDKASLQYNTKVTCYKTGWDNYRILGL